MGRSYTYINNICYDDKGEIHTVKYHNLIPMLLSVVAGAGQKMSVAQLERRDK
jgi:hypothetical protein